MKDILEGYMIDRGHSFVYARADFANLHRETEKGAWLGILYPLKFQDTVDEYGGVTARRWEAQFLILTPSHLDDSYPKRYEDYIKPAQDTIEGPLKGYLSACTAEFTINQWRVEEVVNLLNHNMDGVYITFQATQDVPT